MCKHVKHLCCILLLSNYYIQYDSSIVIIYVKILLLFCYSEYIIFLHVHSTCFHDFFLLKHNFRTNFSTELLKNYNLDREVPLKRIFFITLSQLKITLRFKVYIATLLCTMLSQTGGSIFFKLNGPILSDITKRDFAYEAPISYIPCMSILIQ